MLERLFKISESINKHIIDTQFENKVYIVGGAVRDILLKKKEIKDIDIVVNLPMGGVALAEYLTRKLGVYKKDSNPVIFGRFGTANFRLPNSDLDFESVMSRQEAYEEGSRKPLVKFGTIEQDAVRRDFTINSLMYNISLNKLEDFTGNGINDLGNNVLNTTSDPDSIFKEDPLRMLRAIRFSTRGFKLTKDVYDSIIRNYKSTEILSKERINSEFTKIMLSDNCLNGLYYLVKTGLINYIIPELIETIDFKQNEYHSADLFNHLFDVLQAVVKKPILENENKLVVRLSALLHDIGKLKTRVWNSDKNDYSFIDHNTLSETMVIDILKRLKYENEIVDSVSFIVKNHMHTKQWGNETLNIKDKSIRKLIKLSGNLLTELLEVIHADNISHAPEHCLPYQVPNIAKRIAELKEKHEPVSMPISGKDIINTFNIKPGIKVGEYMRKAEDIFMENPNISKEELLKLLNKV